MVFDAFASLGLAGNIVQFLDSTDKLISDTREIYASAEGASSWHLVLEAVAENLCQLTEAINTAASTGSHTSEVGLGSLVDECHNISRTLLSVLDDLTIKGTHSKWKRSLQALREVRKISQVEDVSERLIKLQDALNTCLAAMMNEKQSAVLSRLEVFAEENRRMELQSSQNIDSFKQEVLSILSSLQQNSLFQTRHLSLLQVRNTRLAEAAEIQQVSDNRRRLSARLITVATEGQALIPQQMFLKSLYFREMHFRHASIPRAHVSTLEWIFGRPHSEHLTFPPRFREWLYNSSGIYWIHGKAGSGKSTLMRFLFDSRRTQAALRLWAGQKRLIVAKFFFWIGGNDLQRSQKGMFRSLLFEILRQCPELITVVCPERANLTYEWEHQPWTLEELLRVFDRLKILDQLPARFCFFIDGLDEYKENHGHLIGTIQALATSADIKICVSSRPWYIFRDAFGRQSGRMLSLEELNQHDIRLYVRDKLEENPHFALRQDDDDRYKKLVQEIVDMAQGVFLWVFLVVRSLNQGLANGDRISDLHRRLRRVPTDLEKYFRQILDSIEPEYREKMAQSFLVALESSQPLGLLTFSFTEDSLDSVLDRSVSPLRTEEVFRREKLMRRRLDCWCKGLLEVSRDLSKITFDSSDRLKVDFLHRTVRDFLTNKSMRRWLKKQAGSRFNQNLILSKAFLAQMKAVQFSWTTFSSYGHLVIWNSRQVEKATGTSPVKILDMTRELFFHHRKETGRDLFYREIMHHGLDLYIAYREGQKHGFLQRKGNKLLQHALECPADEFHNRVPLNPNMISLLLQHGARPNRITWSNFVVLLRDNELENHDAVFQTVKLLLKSGADPTQRIRSPAFKNPTFAGDIADAETWLSEVRNEWTKPASQILSTHPDFTENQKNELTTLAKTIKRGLSFRLRNILRKARGKLLHEQSCLGFQAGRRDPDP